VLARHPRPTLTALAVVAIGVALTAAPAQAQAPEGKAQVCGIPPGDGAYSYIKAWNISCERASKVAGKVGDQFCDSSQKCSPAVGEFNRGHERFRGWDCGLKVGYEFFRVRCERPGKRFVQESAA
jgi:hypothetical protein